MTYANTIDRSETSTFDAAGWLVRIDADHDADGNVDRFETREHDAAGRILDHYWTNFEIEKIADTTYAYDDRGRAVSRDRRVTLADRVLEDTSTTVTYGGTCP